jgi:purine-nucleoside phosphorylase
MTHLDSTTVILPLDAIAAAELIRQRWSSRPEAALVLGTGLGGLSALIDAEVAIPYTDLPGFPRSTAIGHRGRLVCGRLADKPVIVMDGRCHGYEGYSVDQLMLPIYTARALGAEALILSNASGGLNHLFSSGDVMIVDDHINLMAWRCSPSATLGLAPRRRNRVYDPVLIDQALWIARRENFVTHRGVYVAMTGPNYETRAEYRFLRRIGGDVVGMSTVPEVVAAARCGLRTLALSIVTNVARPDHPQVVLAEDVVQAAEGSEPFVAKIVQAVVSDPWPRTNGHQDSHC